MHKYPQFSKQDINWRTPEKFKEVLNNEFSFDFDPCPYKSSFNGLDIEWGQSNFVNPPYGKDLVFWMRKAYLQSQKGKVVVCLVPARTDTEWWHRYALKANEIRFIRGRLKFQGAKYNAPFPSCIIIFRGRGTTGAY